MSAVYDDDLRSFLGQLGVLARVEHGEARCKFCRRPVSLDTLGAVFPEGGDVKFTCGDPACLRALAELRSQAFGNDSAAHPLPVGSTNQ